MKNKTKPQHQTDAKIIAQAKAMGPTAYEAFEKHSAELRVMLDKAQEYSQEELLGFLLAFALTGNEISRRNNIKP